MRQRLRFVTTLESGLYSMSELCERFGVSRRTGYKWMSRWLEGGHEGLADRSRRPHRSPGKTPRSIEDLLIDLRRRHPEWGPKKLLGFLKGREPGCELPATSTVAAILKREGLIEPRRRRRRCQHPGRPVCPVRAPNELWTADFKGQFKTRDGVYCYPLTVADQHSRYVLACQGLPSTKGAGVRSVFERLFDRHGLPQAILTDNGVPFVAHGMYGLTALSVWWIQLGIRHLRIEPGKPQQNGRHERMHRTLKRHTQRPPAANLPAQQRAFDAFRREFNQVRPHEALDMKTPSSVWHPSQRRYPPRIVEPTYPGHFLTRRLSNVGTFRFKGHRLFLSDALKTQTIGLEEIDDGIWSVHFYGVLLARLDERSWELIA